MKRFYARILSLLAAFVLLLPAGAALADTRVNLASLSDDELVALLEQVNAEVVSRGIRKTAVLPKGAYIAGRDIPAGRYVFTCMARGSDWGNVTVYSDGGKGKQLMWHVMAAPDAGEEPEQVYITLSEGDELKSGIPFSLTVAGGVVFR